MGDCVFCKIIEGEIPSARVWEDENFLAFLSIRPINPGHTLVIPKKHSSYLFDMEDKDLGQLMIACKLIARAIKKAFNPQTGKVGVMVAGGEVPHVHIHLIPMNNEGDLTFARQKFDVPFSEIEENAKKIKAALSGN